MKYLFITLFLGLFACSSINEPKPMDIMQTKTVYFDGGMLTLYPEYAHTLIVKNVSKTKNLLIMNAFFYYNSNPPSYSFYGFNDILTIPPDSSKKFVFDSHNCWLLLN